MQPKRENRPFVYEHITDVRASVSGVCAPQVTVLNPTVDVLRVDSNMHDWYRDCAVSLIASTLQGFLDLPADERTAALDAYFRSRAASRPSSPVVVMMRRIAETSRSIVRVPSTVNNKEKNNGR